MDYTDQPALHKHTNMYYIQRIYTHIHSNWQANAERAQCLEGGLPGHDEIFIFKAGDQSLHNL